MIQIYLIQSNFADNYQLNIYFFDTILVQVFIYFNPIFRIYFLFLLQAVFKISLKQYVDKNKHIFTDRILTSNRNVHRLKFLIVQN